MKIKTIVIYHGNCADGFGAAWAIYHKFGDEYDYYPAKYQQDPPAVEGLNVIMVDFCYKRDVMTHIAKKANSLLLLDHHKSASEDMDGFQAEMRNQGFAVSVVFDMNRSGAGMTWDFFHDVDRRPQLIDIIEDRDLWKFKYSFTREVQAALFSYPYDFAVWDDLMLDTPIAQLKQEGVAIERKHFKDIQELISVVTHEMVIGGHKVKVANLPYTMTSDAGHALAQNAPFGGCYWDTPTGREFSLRSTNDGLDVSRIAVQYGGGGHRNAAGFRVPFDHELCRHG